MGVTIPPNGGQISVNSLPAYYEDDFTSNTFEPKNEDTVFINKKTLLKITFEKTAKNIYFAYYFVKFIYSPLDENI